MSAEESIFRSALRSLCKTFAIFLGIFLACIFIVFVSSSLSSPGLLPEKSEMAIAPDANGERKILAGPVPVILKIDIRGVIGMNDLTTESILDILYDSEESPLQNRIAGIFLCIDSPGGSAIDSKGIYQAIVDYKKKHKIPVFAFIDGLCASGGMEISCAADKIYATEGSIVGSVGVILGSSFLNFSGLMDKIGVSSVTISEGKDKDMMNPYRPRKPGEDACLINLTKESYAQFVDLVVANRPNLDRKKLVEEYGAQVYLAPKGQELGYIDEGKSEYGSALADLVAKTSIGSEEYQVIGLRRPKSLVSLLTQNSFALLSGTVRHEIESKISANSRFHGKLLHLYEP